MKKFDNKTSKQVIFGFEEIVPAKDVLNEELVDIEGGRRGAFADCTSGCTSGTKAAYR